MFIIAIYSIVYTNSAEGYPHHSLAVKDPQASTTL